MCLINIQGVHVKRWNEVLTEDVADDEDSDEVSTWCNDQPKDEIPALVSS